ncbi:MAG TPA: ABC transporter substrate-binding protein [Dehalococcoidia bacterium]|nr:ABC transporter substrate-binding protein [Dehalococcoidia bacterium]
MSAGSYWAKVTRQRIERRRILLATSGIGLSAAALALIGCGSGSNNNASGASGSGASGSSAASGAASGSSAASGASGATGAKSNGLIATPQVTTGKPGGILKHYSTGDATHFDPVSDSAATVVSLSSAPFYPRLLRMNAVEYPKEADGSSSGEAAESYEIGPDKMTITFKMRQNMPWDRRAPTNGRPIDANDVVFSFQKYGALNPNAGALVYDATKAAQAPVESMTATDANTLVVKLHQPYASIIPLLSSYDGLYIEPREADGGFDPRKDVRGHGPFILQEYVPSGSFTWAKNPDFYMKDRPFPDKVEVPIVSDHAQQLAQFKSGGIYTDVVTNSQEDVSATKKDVPKTLLLQDTNYPTTSTNMVVFGWEEGSQFLDVRVRQALSMMIDRQGFIDVINNRDSFAKEGLDLAVRLDSTVAGGWSGYWMDPSDAKTFGDSAQYLQLNLTEAKKLLTAAGFPNGFEMDLNMGPAENYGTVYQKTVELYNGFFLSGGMNSNLKVITPSSNWLSNYSRVYRTASYKPGSGFKGLAVIPERGYVTIALQLYNQFHKDGGGYRGAVPAGGSVLQGDPKLNDMTVQIVQEYDHDNQVKLVQDLTRYVTQQMYYIPNVSAAKALSLWWPAIGNVNAYSSYADSGVWTDQRINWWIDSSKPPLA